MLIFMEKLLLFMIVMHLLENFVHKMELINLVLNLFLLIHLI